MFEKTFEVEDWLVDGVQVTLKSSLPEMYKRSRENRPNNGVDMFEVRIRPCT